MNQEQCDEFNVNKARIRFPSLSSVHIKHNTLRSPTLPTCTFFQL